MLEPARFGSYRNPCAIWACFNIHGLCLHLDQSVEDDDWCGEWERLESLRRMRRRSLGLFSHFMTRASRRSLLRLRNTA
jgi:hypothetical protein